MSQFTDAAQSRRLPVLPASFAAFLSGLGNIVFAYLLLLAVHAYLGQWTPSYLEGRDLWHFAISRMVVPMVMLGALAAFIRLVPAALLLTALLLALGTISAIKREATGEPIQISDLFLAGQGADLLGYVSWTDWLKGAAAIPAAAYALANLRFRRWSLPLFAVSAALLSTYRFETVVNLIHDNSYRIGVENLTFSQAESERMNGLATHLYFSTAGLRLKTFSDTEVKAALAALGPIPAPPATTAATPPDIYIVAGEAWWRDPWDPDSPIDKLVKAGFAEGKAVSPVYGGTTPNAEFEVLTGIPLRSFQAGIIPYQHYQRYFASMSRSLPRLLSEIGYRPRAYHNFTRRFWLRDKVYPRFGFESFDSLEDMNVTVPENGWPADKALYAKALERVSDQGPQFNYLVTVETHGPYKQDGQKDVIGGELHPGITDYRNRLSSAVDSLLAFNAALRAKGRPYMLLVFGDHLPGLRLHQWKSGITSESDPRLHETTFLVYSNSSDTAALRDRLNGRPYFCFSPTLVDWIGLNVTDRYFRYLAGRCQDDNAAGFIPAEAVIQNQIFSDRPER